MFARRLHVDEVRSITQIARRIAAILMMEKALDASHLACSADPFDGGCRTTLSHDEVPKRPS